MWGVQGFFRKGSKKGLSKRHLKGRNAPFREYDPHRMHPSKGGRGCPKCCDGGSSALAMGCWWRPLVQSSQCLQEQCAFTEFGVSHFSQKLLMLSWTFQEFLFGILFVDRKGTARRRQNQENPCKTKGTNRNAKVRIGENPPVGPPPSTSHSLAARESQPQSQHLGPNEITTPNCACKTFLRKKKKTFRLIIDVRKIIVDVLLSNNFRDKGDPWASGRKGQECARGMPSAFHGEIVGRKQGYKRNPLLWVSLGDLIVESWGVAKCPQFQVLQRYNEINTQNARCHIAPEK